MEGTVETDTRWWPDKGHTGPRVEYEVKEIKVVLETVDLMIPPV